jgi:hypothetical protein
MNALLELHIAPNRLYRINLCAVSIFKSNAYLKFATLSAPNSFKKSGTEIAQAPPKLHSCGQINRVPTKNHGANGAQ